MTGKRGDRRQLLSPSKFVPISLYPFCRFPFLGFFHRCRRIPPDHGAVRSACELLSAQASRRRHRPGDGQAGTEQEQLQRRECPPPAASPRFGRSKCNRWCRRQPRRPSGNG